MSYKLSPLIFWSRPAGTFSLSFFSGDKADDARRTDEQWSPAVSHNAFTQFQSFTSFTPLYLSHRPVQGSFNSSLLNLFSELFSINSKRFFFRCSVNVQCIENKKENVIRGLCYLWILNIWLSMHKAFDSLNHFNITNDENLAPTSVERYKWSVVRSERWNVLSFVREWRSAKGSEGEAFLYSTFNCNLHWASCFIVLLSPQTSSSELMEGKVKRAKGSTYLFQLVFIVSQWFVISNWKICCNQIILMTRRGLREPVIALFNKYTSSLCQ